ncbi:MAG: MotA/TolQ/ExbB proton channel family protein [Gemmataceae bacterium]
MTLFAETDLLHSGAMGYMLKGGYFMWPILFMAILATGVVIERFRSLRLIATDAAALRAQVLDLLHEDKVEEAIDLCSRSRGPVPAILAVGLHRYELLRKLDYDPAKIEEQVVKAMDDYAVHIEAALQKNLAVLSTVATVAPMVGSLGTVVGMVVLFRDVVEKFGTQNIILAAAAGIELKLIVTVWGLMVGIPAYIFFNYFTAVVNRYILEAEETASQLIESLTLRLASDMPRDAARARVGGGA